MSPARFTNPDMLKQKLVWIRWKIKRWIEVIVDEK
jgi:hypothetical protein